MRLDLHFLPSPLRSVSTLIRPEGRMRLADGAGALNFLMFQPSSDPKAGCDVL